jgi:CHAT domain/FHA domain
MNPEAVQYEFWEGVREGLLESVPTRDSVNVLQEVSEFIAERLGLSLNEFMAVLRKPQQRKNWELASQSRPFAMMTAQILRQLGGGYAQFAKELEQQYEELERQHIEPKQSLADIWKQSQRFIKNADIPCLSLAIDRLRASEAIHFAIYVIQAPYRGGYVLHDNIWTEALAQEWQGWQEMFASRGVPPVPHVSQVNLPPQVPNQETTPTAHPVPITVRLMQNLGISLWRWLFAGPIQASLNQSQGIAMGQNKPLRLRLDVRDPDLIAIPWEIMQHQAGKQAISLGTQQILFSRTTSDVDALPPLRTDHSLNILLVLGQDDAPTVQPISGKVSDAQSANLRTLKLEQESAALSQLLTQPSRAGGFYTAPCYVDVLLQPTPTELIQRLETQAYNVLFYDGQGMPAPDGGLLFLQSGQTLSGTELAQVLTRCRVKLAISHTDWGARPDQQGDQTIPRSSFAEVLILHGVPAVLAMRDAITTQEALSFIEAFAQALAERMPIDQAVAVARQHLLTLFKFNQPTWTVPMLYMHPAFDGELAKPLPPEDDGALAPLDSSVAMLRSTTSDKVWRARGGLIRVGRTADNDLILKGELRVSRKHAEIFHRYSGNDSNQISYFLRDFSRYGTWLLGANGWQKIHQQEVPLVSGNQLKFGDPQSSILEFYIESSE